MPSSLSPKDSECPSTRYRTLKNQATLPTGEFRQIVKVKKTQVPTLNCSKSVSRVRTSTVSWKIGNINTKKKASANIANTNWDKLFSWSKKTHLKRWQVHLDLCPWPKNVKYQGKSFSGRGSNLKEAKRWKRSWHNPGIEIRQMRLKFKCSWRVS